MDFLFNSVFAYFLPQGDSASLSFWEYLWVVPTITAFQATQEPSESIWLPLQAHPGGPMPSGGVVYFEGR